MKMTELDFGGGQPPIDGYAPDGFRIAGAFREGAMLIGPGGVATWNAASLTLEASAPVKALKGSIDIVLIGVGDDLLVVPAEFRAALEPLERDPSGFGVDYMSTPSACRTYNVLLSEGRRVAAALLTIGDGPAT